LGANPYSCVTCNDVHKSCVQVISISEQIISYYIFIAIPTSVFIFLIITTFVYIKRSKNGTLKNKNKNNAGFILVLFIFIKNILDIIWSLL